MTLLSPPILAHSASKLGRTEILDYRDAATGMLIADGPLSARNLITNDASGGT